MSNISDRLLAAIRERQMSYGELAAMTGIAKSSIQRYATGKTNKISLRRLALLVDALCVSADDLLGRTGGGASSEPAEESDEARLIALFRALNLEGQRELLRYADYLSTKCKKGI